MASYKIVSKVDGPVGKFACVVSFNDKAPHYHEVDSLDAAEIAAALQATADADEVASAQVADDTKELSSIQVDADGQIVV